MTSCQYTAILSYRYYIHDRLSYTTTATLSGKKLAYVNNPSYLCTQVE